MQITKLVEAKPVENNNRIRTYIHLVCKRTLNHLAKLIKWLSCVLSTYLHGAFFVSYYHVTCEFQSESKFYSLPECQGTPSSMQAPYLKLNWQQRDSKPRPLTVLWWLICTVHLTVSYYHITYEIQSESTFYSLPECQRTACSMQGPYLKFTWHKRDSDPQLLSSETNTQSYS